MRYFKVAAMVIVALTQAAYGSVLAPQKSLRALGGRQVWVPICSRRGVNGSAPWFDSTSTAIMDQQACLSPTWGTVSALKLVYAAFDMPQQGEVDRPVIATGTASVFVPGSNTITVYGGNGVSAGSTTLNQFQATGLGANGISLGESVTSSGGGVAPASFVTTVSNSFVAGPGNSPVSTVVVINQGTTAATANGQPFTFSGALTPVKFGGKRSFVIEPGHDVVTSDAVGVQVLPGSWFMVRTAAAFSGPGLQLMDIPNTARLTIPGTGFSEFDNRSTSLNDQTMNPLQLTNTGGGYWGPVAVLALVTPSIGQVPPGGVLVLGDSIAAGTGDIADSNGYEGYIQRSLTNTVPFISAARGSTTAFSLVAHGDGQSALMTDAGITDVLLESGRNDIEQFSLTAAELDTPAPGFPLGYIPALAARFSAAGKRVWCFTIPPTTYSGDGWVTLTNQAFPFSVNLTAASVTNAGAAQIVMSSVANIAPGLAVSLNTASQNAIPAGTTVVSVNASTSIIGLSGSITASIPAGARLFFGTPNTSASPLEVQRLIYNGFLRSSFKAMGCSGVVDVANVMEDQAGSGKWRVDLGPASSDGVHPSAVLHSAVVTAKLLNPSMFPAQ